MQYSVLREQQFVGRDTTGSGCRGGMMDAGFPTWQCTSTIPLGLKTLGVTTPVYYSGQCGWLASTTIATSRGLWYRFLALHPSLGVRHQVEDECGADAKESDSRGVWHLLISCMKGCFLD